MCSHKFMCSYKCKLLIQLVKSKTWDGTVLNLTSIRGTVVSLSKTLYPLISSC